MQLYKNRILLEYILRVVLDMLGKNIKEYRLEKGLTQKELAENIGVTQGTIHFWEQEINEPSSGYIVKLANYFNISTDELLSYEKRNKDYSLPPKLEKLIRTFNSLTESQQDLALSIINEIAKN